MVATYQIPVRIFRGLTGQYFIPPNPLKAGASCLIMNNFACSYYYSGFSSVVRRLATLRAGGYGLAFLTHRTGTAMSNSFQSAIPKVRINLRLGLHTGGAQKKSELPLKLVLSGDFSYGRETALLSEINKVNINKLNMQLVLADFATSICINVKHTDGDEVTEEKSSLTFCPMKDFSPEQVVPRLQAMRALLRDLRENLLHDAGFRRELQGHPDLSDELRAGIAALALRNV